MRTQVRDSTELKKKLKEWACRVDEQLLRCLPPKDSVPRQIHEAMHYAIFSGGKRLRPILAIASCEACGGTLDQVIVPSCAIEIFHTFSLVHDDLPSLDNDDFRRGKPTCHRRFGEATALLAGDALLNLGFKVLASIPNGEVAVRLIREFSDALGTHGMIGGQVVDLDLMTRPMSRAHLNYVHVHKTAKLMQASCLTGAIAALARPSEQKALSEFGRDLGLAFQLVDDIMDENGYVRLTNKARAREKAREVTERAKGHVSILGDRGELLKKLADFLLVRDH